MSKFYNRKAQLLFSDVKGTTLDLSELHFTFEILKNNLPVPNACNFTIYNLGKTTAKAIVEQYTKITLIAGYEDLSGVIFTGEVVRSEYGYSIPDSEFNLVCADGYFGITNAVVNKTLSEGATIAGVVGELNDSFSSFGIKKGIQQPIIAPLFQRGLTMCGNSMAQLQQLAIAFDFNGSIQDGKLNIVRDDFYLPNEIAILSPASGLIGVPTQTLEGIHLTCLLNPKMKIEGLVKLDNDLINKFAIDVRIRELDPSIALESTGLYKILQITYVGDNRGDDWFNEIICVGLNNSIPRGFDLGSKGIFS